MTTIDDVIRLLEAAKSTGQTTSTQRSTTKKNNSSKKTKRKPTAAQKAYGRHFKRLAPKYKKKSGGWKKDGFKRCAAAARKAAKK